MKMGTVSRGFTLIELLVVLAVVGLLLSLVVPRYSGNVDQAKEVVLRENLAVVRDAIDKHFADKGRYPESLEALVQLRYLRNLPVDPITDSTQTWVLLPPGNPALGKVFDVRSGATGVARNGRAYGEL
jgi:general secretion pathway protein G